MSCSPSDLATFTLAQIRPMLDVPPADDELATLLQEGRATAEQERQRIDHQLASIGARLHLLEGALTMSAHHDSLDKTAPAIPLAADATTEYDELPILERPRLRVAATVHTGPLDDLASAYAAVIQWIEARGLVPVGGAAELSRVWDPQHADPNVTELQLPVTTAEGS